MEVLVFIIPALQVIFALLCGVALIYFILKRINDKKSEKFENRDN